MSAPPETIDGGTKARRLRGDRGGSLVSLLMLAPILVMFLEIIVLGGRVAAAHADIQSAAREAARQASLAGGPGSAPTVIGPVVTTALNGKGFQCQSPNVQIGAGTNFVAGGQVEIEVTCTVQLSDLGFFIPMPGSLTITRAAAEPIDRYRVVN